MSNKELIKEIIERLTNNERMFFEDCILLQKSVKALKDAEVEIEHHIETRKKEFHRLSKIIDYNEQEINRLKWEAKKQAAVHVDEEAKLLEEINRLKAELKDEKMNHDLTKLGQVDPIELIRFTCSLVWPNHKLTNEGEQQILEQFKKERE
jgi:hypothetical protein